MKRSRIFSRGFTLIELMVVVAIIAILVTIGLATYRNAQNRANDSRMMAGARSMQAVAEQLYAQSNAYPSSLSASDFSNNALPTDVTYSRTGSAPSYTYCIQTAVFKTTGSPGANCAATCNFAGTPNRFCLKNLQ